MLAKVERGKRRILARSGISIKQWQWGLFESASFSFSGSRLQGQRPPKEGTDAQADERETGSVTWVQGKWTPDYRQPPARLELN